MSSDEKDVEELLKIARLPTQAPVDEVRPLTEAHRFALHNGIKAGTHKIRSALIYEYYKKWKEGKNLQSKTRFFSDFGKLFEKWQNANYVYYKLDPTSFQLSDDAYEKIRDAILK